MKKFLIYLFSLSIILCTNSNSEIFKSKNGYILNLPNKYEVMEREYLGSHMTIIYNKKKHDGGKNIMFVMVNNDTEAMNLLKTYKEVNIGDEFCNTIHQLYKEMTPNVKNLELYQCTKKTAVKLSHVLKTIYDSEHPNYIMYQYSFSSNNKLVMISGTCKKNNCGDRDRKLIKISNSFKW